MSSTHSAPSTPESSKKAVSRVGRAASITKPPSSSPGSPSLSSKKSRSKKDLKGTEYASSSREDLNGSSSSDSEEEDVPQQPHRSTGPSPPQRSGYAKKFTDANVTPPSAGGSAAAALATPPPPSAGGSAAAILACAPPPSAGGSAAAVVAAAAARRRHQEGRKEGKTSSSSSSPSRRASPTSTMAPAVAAAAAAAKVPSQGGYGSTDSGGKGGGSSDIESYSDVPNEFNASSSFDDNSVDFDESDGDSLHASSSSSLRSLSNPRSRRAAGPGPAGGANSNLPSPRGPRGGRPRTPEPESDRDFDTPTFSDSSDSETVESLKPTRSKKSLGKESPRRKGKGFTIRPLSLVPRYPTVIFKDSAPQQTGPTGNRSRAISFATVDGLISMLADPQAFQDKTFLDIFILSYEYFMDSASLLRKLIRLYQNPPLEAAATPQVSTASTSSSPSNSTLGDAAATEESAAASLASNIIFFQLRVINVLKKLIEMKYYGIRKQKKCYTALTKFMHDLAHKGDEREKGWANHLRSSMKQNAEFIRPVTEDPPPPVLVKSSSTSGSSTKIAGANASGTAASGGQAAASTGGVGNGTVSPTGASSVLSGIASSAGATGTSNSQSGTATTNTTPSSSAASSSTHPPSASTSATEQPQQQQQQPSMGGSASGLGFGAPQRSLNDFSARELARHLTQIDYDLWSSIKMDEFYHAVFAGKDKDKLAPNIARYIKRFNDVSAWVASSIVLAPKKKQRANILSKFIQVMDELRRIRNFNGMMAFYSALNLGAIQRLKKTWREVPSKVMSVYNAVAKFMDSAQNYKTYKDFLRVADPPSIPYMGFILSDLVYSEEYSTWYEVDTAALAESPALLAAYLVPPSTLTNTGTTNPTTTATDSAPPLGSNNNGLEGSDDSDAVDAQQPTLPLIPYSDSPSSPHDNATDSGLTNSLIEDSVGGDSPATSDRDRGDSSAGLQIPSSPRYVSWAKMSLLASSFGDILRFQRTRFNFLEVKEIAEYVCDLTKHSWSLSDNELNEMSKNIEPDGSGPIDGSTGPDYVDGVRSQLSNSSLSSSSNSIDSPSKNKGKKRGTNTVKKVVVYEDLPRDPALFDDFRKHLVSRFNSENLLFWEAVYKFKSQSNFNDYPEVKKRAEEIVAKFITGKLHNSEFVVGINPTVSREIRKTMDADEITPILFDRALEEVEHVTLKPSFNEYLKTIQG